MQSSHGFYGFGIIYLGFTIMKPVDIIDSSSNLVDLTKITAPENYIKLTVRPRKWAFPGGK